MPITNGMLSRALVIGPTKGLMRAVSDIASWRLRSGLGSLRATPELTRQAADVLALSAAEGGRYGREALACGLIEGGVLATDQDVVRKTARAMLQVALSCRDNMTNSGIVARVAGDAIDAKRFLPNMATEEFLSCLSKAALEKAAAAEGVEVGRGARTPAPTSSRGSGRAPTSTRAPCSHPPRTKSPTPRATRATGTRAAARTTLATGNGRAPGTTMRAPRTAPTRVRRATQARTSYPPPRNDPPAPAR
jgi:hypothetical protein